MSDPVRAAGGVVWRRRDGRIEVLVVHRPTYGDWSLPKGKVDPGESDEDCALREVEEETGYRAALEAPAGEVRYRDGRGRPKVVRYWRMTALGHTGRDVSGEEVDEVAWWDLAEALDRLSYEPDRDLVRALRGL